MTDKQGVRKEPRGDGQVRNHFIQIVFVLSIFPSVVNIYHKKTPFKAKLLE